MIVNRTSAPAALLTAAEIKAHTRIDTSAEDTLIDTYIAAATAVIDGPNGESGRALGSQVWTAETYPITGRSGFIFPVAPVISVDEITYFDGDNAQQTASVSGFTIRRTEDWTEVKPNIGTHWPTMYQRKDALKITATCGYATVPENILQAIRLMTAWLYRHEGDENVEMPDGIARVLDPSRLRWIGA